MEKSFKELSAQDTRKQAVSAVASNNNPTILIGGTQRSATVRLPDTNGTAQNEIAINNVENNFGYLNKMQEYSETSKTAQTIKGKQQTTQTAQPYDFSNGLPSFGQVSQQIASVYKSGDTQRAADSLAQFQTAMNTAGNPYYQPYSTKATNAKLLSSISELTGIDFSNGISASDIENLWKYADTSATTNSGAYSSSSKLTPAQQLAYYLTQLQSDEEYTQKAEQELQTMYSEINWLVARGYSDDYIRENVLMSNYSTLAKAVENTTAGHSLSVFNRGINFYGDDTINGMIYAARHGSSYDGLGSIMQYYGNGSGYTANEYAEQARDFTSDYYHPYAFGASDNTKMDSVCKVVGKTGYTREDLNDPNTKTALMNAGLWETANEAVENYEAAVSELKSLETYMQSLLDGGKSYDECVVELGKIMDGSAFNADKFKTLRKMEEARTKGKAHSAILMSDSVNFAVPYFTQSWLAKAYNETAERKYKENKNTLIANTGSEENANTILGFIAVENNEIDENGKYVGKGVGYDEGIAYATEHNLFKKEGETDEQYSERLKAYSYTLADKKAKEEQERLEAEAAKITPNSNFKYSEFGNGKDEKELADAEYNLDRGLDAYFRGKPVTEQATVDFVNKYPALFGGVTTYEVAEPHGMATYERDERKNFFGDTVGSIINEADDARRDGYLSNDEYYSYLKGMATIIDKANGDGRLVGEWYAQGIPAVVEAVDSAKGVIESNKVAQEEKRIKEGKETFTAAFNLLNDSDASSWTDTDKMMYQQIEAVDLTNVADEGYSNAKKSIDSYFTDAITRDKYGSSRTDVYTGLVGIAWAGATTIMKAAYVAGISFDEAMESAGYSSVDDFVDKSISNAWDVYRTSTYEMYESLEAIVAKPEYLESAKKANRQLVNTTAAMGQEFNLHTALTNDTTRTAMLEAMVSDGYMTREQADEINSLYSQGDTDTLEALDKLMTTASENGSFDYNSKEFIDFKKEHMDWIGDATWDAFKAFEEGTAASAAYTPQGDSTSVKGVANALWMGTKKGAVLHAESWGEFAYSLVNYDANHLETMYRNTYPTRQLAANAILDGINKIENEELKQTALNDFNSYTGDIYDYKFNIYSVGVKNWLKAREQDVNDYDREMAEIASPAEWWAYNATATTINSAAISGEALVTGALLSAAGMPEGAALFLAQLMTTGATEGSAVYNDVIERGGSESEAYTRGAAVGTVVAGLEYALDDTFNHALGAMGMGTHVDAVFDNKAALLNSSVAKYLYGTSLAKKTVGKSAVSIADVLSLSSRGLINTMARIGNNAVFEPVQEALETGVTQFGTNFGYDNGQKWYDIDEITNSYIETIKSAPFQAILGGAITTPAAKTVNALTGNLANAPAQQKESSVGNLVRGYKDSQVVVDEINARNEQLMESQSLSAEDYAAQIVMQEIEAAGSYAKWLDEICDSCAVDKLTSDEMGEIVKATLAGELGQARIDAETAVTETQAVLEDTQKKLETAEKEYAKVEQEYNESKAPKKDLIQRYTTMGDAVASLREGLTAAQTAFENAKQSVINANKAITDSLKSAHAETRAKAEAFIAGVKEARAAKVAAQKDEYIALQKAGVAAQNELQLKELEKNRGEWFADRARGLVEHFGKDVLAEYGDKVIEAKGVLFDMIQDAFHGWNIQYDENLPGGMATDTETHTLIINPNRTIEEMFGDLMSHELFHVIKTDGRAFTQLEDAVIEANGWGSETSKAFNDRMVEVAQLYGYLTPDQTSLETLDKKQLETVREEVIAQGIADIFTGKVNGKAFSLFAGYMTKNGGIDFGGSLYNFMLRQAENIKKKNAVNGIFKDRLNDIQVGYARVINAFADAIKTAIDENNRLFMERHGSFAEKSEAVSSDSENTASVPVVADENEANVSGEGKSLTEENASESTEVTDEEELKIEEPKNPLRIDPQETLGLDSEEDRQKTHDELYHDYVIDVQDTVAAYGVDASAEDINDIHNAINALPGLDFEERAYLHELTDGVESKMPTAPAKDIKPVKDEINISDRSYSDNLGSKKIKPYYDKHWSEFRYAAGMAQAILGDLSNLVIPGHREWINDTTTTTVKYNPTEVIGIKRHSSDGIIELKAQTNATYEQLKEGLQKFIDSYVESKSLPNEALIKRIEVAMHEFLTNGYRFTDNAYPALVPNEGYIFLNTESKTNNAKSSDAVKNSVFDRTAGSSALEYISSAKELDAEYEAADDETKRKMLDKAAADAGYTYKGYHGTNSEFYTFDISKSSSMNDMGKGFYFSTNQIDGESYSKSDGENQDVVDKATSYAYDKAYETEYDEDSSEFTEAFNDAYDEFVNNYKENGRTIGAYLKLNNPFIISDDNYITVEEAHDIISKADTYTKSDLISAVNREAKSGLVKTSLLLNSNDGSKLADVIRNGKKYDGIIDKTVSDKFNLDKNTDHIIVFDSSQIKSADLDTGVPLSQRFNSSNPDIRYSLFSSPGDNALSNIVETLDYALHSSISKGETTKAAQIASKMFALINKGDKANGLATPTDSLRTMVARLGSNLYEKVQFKEDAPTDVGIDMRSKAMFTDRVTAENFKRQIVNASELVKQHLSQKNITAPEDASNGVTFDAYFFDYMTHTDAQINAVNAYRNIASQFASALDSDSVLKKVINDAREQITGYFAATSYQKTISQIRSLSEARSQRKDKSGLRGFVQGMLDEMESTRLVDNLYANIMGERDKGELHREALYTHYSADIAKSWWSGDSRVDYNGQRIDGETNVQICERLGINWKKDYDDIRAYQVAQEAYDRYNNDKAPFDAEGDVTTDFDSKISLTKDDCINTMNEIKSRNPKVVEYCKAFNELWDSFMRNVMVAGGVISEQEYNRMSSEHPHYAPLKREDNTYSFSLAEGGSNKQIITPSEMMFNMMNQFAQKAATNQILRKFDEMYTKAGDMGSLAVRWTPEDLKNDGITKLPPNAIKLLNSDGTYTYYNIKDESLRSVLNGNIGNPVSTGKVLNWLGKSTRAMSALTTGVNVIFAGKNALRDFQHSVNYGSWASNYVTGLIKWIGAAYDVTKEELSGKGSETIKDFNAMGGGGWQRVNLRENKSARSWKNEAFGYTNKASKIGRWALNFIEAESLNSIIETTSRYAEYKYGKHDLSTAEGKKEAFMASMEATVDFRRHGNSAVLQMLKQVVPFFNATLQGQYQDVRMLTENYDGRRNVRIAKMVFNNVAMGALSAASFMFANVLKGMVGNCDDDGEDYAQMYLDLQDDMKQQYILIPGFWMNGARDCYRIPLTQGSLSQIAYEFGRKTVESIFTGEREDLVSSEFGADLINMAWNATVGGITGMTTIVSPFLNVAMNRNWYGSKIIYDSVKKRSLPNQLDTSTSDAFIYAADVFNGLLSMLDDDNIIKQALASPIALQYITQQYTGIIGQLAIPMLAPDRYTGEVTPISSIKNTLKNAWTLDMDASSDITEAYTKDTDMLERIVSDGGYGYGKLDPRLSEEEASSAWAAAKNFISSGGAIYELGNQIAELNSEYTSILSDTSISKSERQSKAEAIKREIVDLKKQGLKELEPYKAQYLGGDIFTRVAAAVGGGYRNRINEMSMPDYKMYNLSQDTLYADDVANNAEYLQTAKKMYIKYADEHNGSFSNSMMPNSPDSFTQDGVDYEIKDEYREQADKIYYDAYKEAAAQIMPYLDYADDPTKEWRKVHDYARNAVKSWYFTLDNID